VTSRSPIGLAQPSGEVFRALADPTRRAILEALLIEDGQTLTRLCADLTSLTRFTVMKHLAVLENAGLIATRKVGRHKQHHLNRVPLAEATAWLKRFFGRNTSPLGVDELFRSTENSSQLLLW
jgi:DNA-binding transcriptional ArsR family regulator